MCQTKDYKLGHLSYCGMASTPDSSEQGASALVVRHKLPSCRGVANMADMDETFVQPLAVPKLPARFYFRFQAPIRTRPEDLEDRDKCDSLYRQTKVSCALCP